MNILHVSAECYPFAKIGGLGDVVGALPKYQQAAGHFADVIIPMHRTDFLYTHEWRVVSKSGINFGARYIEYTIITPKDKATLGFNLYLVDINGMLDREKVYGYDDDADRYLAFQIAVLDWINKQIILPDIIHCHEHHAGLIPFMAKHCFVYHHLSHIPTILTIHNAQYQGWMDWEKAALIPAWDIAKGGELDWNGSINSLAAAIKCANKVTTVSPSYMKELRYNSKGLEMLFRNEQEKCQGVLNGIDSETWDPATDHFLDHHYNVATVQEGKRKNKEAVCKMLNLDDANEPLFIFIGRLVEDKGADLLPGALITAAHLCYGKANYIMLGSGEETIEWRLRSVKSFLETNYHTTVGYNEKMSHQLYAAADFLLMPSRVEPCGLNQMYALRYGTIPIVRRTGGLIDTITDIGDPDGFGLCFNYATEEDIVHGITRAISIYEDTSKTHKMRAQSMQIDHSWKKSIHEYLDIYQSVLP